MAEFIGSAEGEVLIGTVANDVMMAAGNNVTLIGLAGNDTLSSDPGVDGTTMDGGPGNDVLFSRGTNDTASYASAPSGVIVDLSADESIPGVILRFATDGYIGSQDALFNIENVTGSAFDDILSGSDLANVIEGGGGAMTS